MPDDRRDLDEFGLPMEWRRDEVETSFLDEYPDEWRQFEEWCAAQGRRAFPSSPETVLRFLLSGPVTGESVYRTWAAIDFHHSAYYWHVDANPVGLLQIQHVEVTGEGRIEVPKPVLARYGVG